MILEITGETLIKVGNNYEKEVTPLNRELYLKAEHILEAEALTLHIGWHGLGKFIDYLEENYNIVKKGK